MKVLALAVVLGLMASSGFAGNGSSIDDESKAKNLHGTSLAPHCICIDEQLAANLACVEPPISLTALKFGRCTPATTVRQLAG